MGHLLTLAKRKWGCMGVDLVRGGDVSSIAPAGVPRENCRDSARAEVGVLDRESRSTWNVRLIRVFYQRTKPCDAWKRPLVRDEHRFGQRRASIAQISSGMLSLLIKHFTFGACIFFSTKHVY